MDYRTRLTKRFKELENPFNTYFCAYDLNSSSFRGMKRGEAICKLKWLANHSIDNLTTGIKCTEKRILKCRQTIAACGKIAEFQAAKKSEERNVKLYEKCIDEKKNAIFLYKKVIEICNE